MIAKLLALILLSPVFALYAVVEIVGWLGHACIWASRRFELEFRCGPIHFILRGSWMDFVEGLVYGSALARLPDWLQAARW